jgi:integrase
LGYQAFRALWCRVDYPTSDPRWRHCFWRKVNPKIVQERLEHADISMTLNRYSHVTPDMQRSAADTLDAVFTMVL